MLSIEENKENSESLEIDESTTFDTSINYNNNKDDEETEPKETEELMAKGNVSKSLYWKYFRAGGSILMILTFIWSLVLGQIGSSGCDYWVAYWLIFIVFYFIHNEIYFIYYKNCYFSFFRTKKEEMHIKYYINNNHTLQILKQNLTTSFSSDDMNNLMNKTFLFKIDNFNDTISNFSTLENNSFNNSVSIFIMIYINLRNNSYFSYILYRHGILTQLLKI